MTIPTNALDGVDSVAVMYLYMTPPIDYFEPLLTAEEVYERTKGNRGTDAPVRAYVERCVQALAENTYYSPDDHAMGPFVSAVPDTDYTYPHLIVFVKGINNGTVYVASPIELPSLSDRLEATLDTPRRPEWSQGGDDW